MSRFFTIDESESEGILLRTCRGCGQDKRMPQFGVQHQVAGGVSAICKACRRSATAPYRAKNRAHINARANRNHYRRKYGITQADRDRMLASQGGRCAACGSSESHSTSWHLDHCHATGRVRAVLCLRCNIALGLVNDSADHLSRLIEYLGREPAHV